MAPLPPPGYAYVHRDVGRWRHDGGIYPLFFQKGSNRGGGAFHHWFRSRQVFGVAKDFFPNFPKLPRKAFCATFAYKFSPTKITVCWCDFQKRSSCVFMQTLGASVWNKAMSGTIYFHPDFQVCFFSANQNFWGWACTPCTNASNTIAFHNSIIGNFVVYQNRLEINLLQLFERPENSELFCIISVIIFEATLLMNRTKNLFFISFHCPQLFHCPPLPYRWSPCPTAAPPALPLLRRPWICVLFQQTLPKHWFANLNMTSYCDVTYSVYPVTMITIRPSSILEVGRGSINQAVVPGTTRPPHAIGTALEPHLNSEASHTFFKTKQKLCANDPKSPSTTLMSRQRTIKNQMTSNNLQCDMHFHAEANSRKNENLNCFQRIKFLCMHLPYILHLLYSKCKI